MFIRVQQCPAWFKESTSVSQPWSVQSALKGVQIALKMVMFDAKVLYIRDHSQLEFRKVATSFSRAKSPNCWRSAQPLPLSTQLSLTGGTTAAREVDLRLGPDRYRTLMQLQCQVENQRCL